MAFLAELVWSEIETEAGGEGAGAGQLAEEVERVQIVILVEQV
jgi:hypothetical protein